MLERTAGCLELGSVRRIVPGSMPVNSRRMLHSTFWNHGAMELEQSPLWQALIHGIGPNRKSIEANRANEFDYSGGMMLDFLYPSGATNLIRVCSPWIPDRNEFSRPRTAFGKVGQRLYTSAAGNGVATTFPAAEKFEAGNGQQFMEYRVSEDGSRFKGDATSEASAFLQLMNQSTWRNDYEEAWRLFKLLSPESQPKLAQQLLGYLITSSRAVDAERTISVFDSIKDHADHNSYEALVNAYVCLQNFENATKAHLQSLKTFQKPTASDRLLRQLIEYGRWEMAFETWKGVETFGTKRHRHGYDIWAGAASLPDVDKQALKIAAYFASHLPRSHTRGLSPQLEDDKLKFLNELLSVALFPPGSFSESKFERVFSQLERLGLATETAYQDIIHKLLRMDRTKMVVHLYRKFRQTDGKLSAHVFESILQIFCKNKSSIGMKQVLEDWERCLGRRPTSRAYRAAMKVFASQGDVEIVKDLWKKYVAQQPGGQIRNANNILPLMHIHAKRGELDEVVDIFETMTTKYKIAPNINHSNVLLNAYMKAHAVDKAFKHYNELLGSDIRPDKVTIGTMMSICIQRGDSEAAYELYYSAHDLGIRPNTPMIDCLVLGDIQNDNIAKAEATCMKALTMPLDGPKTRMWNYLLVAYGMKRDLENVTRIHRIMESADVPHDTYTYSALMQALAVAGQPDRAWKILTEVMPQAGVSATEFHYAVVMGGYINTKESHKVFRVRDHMLKRFRGAGLSSNLLTLKAAAMEDSRHMQDGNGDFANAEEYLFKFLVNADRQEIASTTTRKGISNEPLDVAYAASYFDFYMFICGQHKAFDRVRQLYDRFLELLPEDRRSQPPIRLLSAVMISRFKEGDYDGVQEAWDFAMKRGKEKGKPISGNGVILYSQRLSLCRPLSTQIKSLVAQHKYTQLKSTIAELLALGFELDSTNWNMYVQALTNANQYKEAFDVCEKRLMPGWLGWSSVRQIEPRRNRLSIRERALKKDRSYLRPIYHTILMLSRAFMEMEGSQSSSRNIYNTLQHLEKQCPLTLNAIRTMRRTGNELETDILGTSLGG